MKDLNRQINLDDDKEKFAWIIVRVCIMARNTFQVCEEAGVRFHWMQFQIYKQLVLHRRFWKQQHKSVDWFVFDSNTDTGIALSIEMFADADADSDAWGKICAKKTCCYVK